MNNPICKTCKEKEPGCDEWCPDYVRSPKSNKVRKDKRKSGKNKKFIGRNIKYATFDDWE